MKNLIYPFVFIILMGCEKIDPEQRLIKDRINFVLKIKKEVAIASWSNFAIKENEGTLFYYQANNTFVFFLDSITKDKLSFISNKNEIYELGKRYDSIPFHMETQIEFDNSNPILFNHPIEFCSSPEETKKIIPSVTSTEIWATMVLHEMFHHYQFNNKRFREYMKTISNLDYDNRDLKKLLAEDIIFKKLIVNENDLLLHVLQSTSQDSINIYIDRFIEKRLQRRTRYSVKNKFFTKIENAFEKMEGSARYLEYQAMKRMQNLENQNSNFLIKNDTLFNNFVDFKDVNLNNENFDYLKVISYDYYYTLGFNLIRIFEKLGISYQEIIFNQPEKSLTDILINFRKQ